MNFSVKSISVFERQAKRLIKKFPALKNEIQNLIKDLKEEPIRGTSIGHNCYKKKLSVASKGKGKSGGARVITYVISENIVYLISIYDKSEIASLSNKEILILLRLIP